MQKKQYLAATFIGIALIGASLALFRTKPVAAQTARSAAVFHFGRQAAIAERISQMGFRRRSADT
jgi:hypothetical protein